VPREELELVAHTLFEIAPQIDTEVTSRIADDFREFTQSLLGIPDGLNLERDLVVSHLKQDRAMHLTDGPDGPVLVHPNEDTSADLVDGILCGERPSQDLTRSRCP